MANENVQMWTELNIDLKSHDMLLNALGPIFQEVYLSQKNRPAGMGFYDFVVSEIHGLRVKELARAGELLAVSNDPRRQREARLGRVVGVRPVVRRQEAGRRPKLVLARQVVDALGQLLGYALDRRPAAFLLQFLRYLLLTR
jgi:hypothetical protein